jgi:hypothetical protein
VYGSATRELEPAFREYDRALARNLGISVFAGEDYSYKIASILSHEWWDDAAWL